MGLESVSASEDVIGDLKEYKMIFYMSIFEFHNFQVINFQLMCYDSTTKF